MSAIHTGESSNGPAARIARAARFFGGLARSRSALIGLGILAVNLAVALLSPLVVPYSPTETNPGQLFADPSLAHPFGTDQFGRDVFSRVLLGGRVALAVAFSAAALAVLIGGLIGILLGYLGGLIDEISMRFVDAIFAVPGLLLLLVVVTGFGSGYAVLLLALAFSYTPRAIRVSRAAALDFAPREFVIAARARGERGLSIAVREIFPNVRDVLLVEFAMQASWIILTISALSFLGFGVNPPTPDWGLMVTENRGSLGYAPWATFAPILAISILVVGLNLAADGLAKTLGLDRIRNVPE